MCKKIKACVRVIVDVWKRNPVIMSLTFTICTLYQAFVYMWPNLDVIKIHGWDFVHIHTLLLFFIISSLFLFWMFSVWRIVKLQEQLTPKLSLEYSDNGGGRVKTPTILMYENGAIASIYSIYIRGKVTAKTKIAVKKCRAFVTNIEGADFHDSIELPWSLTNNCTEIDIYSGISRYFDIIKIDEHSKKHEFAGLPPLTLKNFFEGKKEVILHLKIFGDDIECEPLVLKLKLGDEWDEISGEVV